MTTDTAIMRIRWHANGIVRGPLNFHTQGDYSMYVLLADITDEANIVKVFDKLNEDFGEHYLRYSKRGPGSFFVECK